MKKYLYTGVALAMALSLGSCNKEIDNPNETPISVKGGIPFEVIANPVETRTTNDGMETKWSAEDGINVFHAVAGSTEYVSDGEFTIAAADLETNTFKGEVSEELTGDAYDWYLFYPYDEHLTTPANETFYTPIGSQKSGAQTQNGNDSMAHLAGENYPLFGKIAGVTAGTIPSFSVNQGSSFIEVTVTNNSESDLTVSEVRFKAPEYIVGTYYINFSDPENVVYTPSQSGSNVFATETATLNVENGTAITKGGSAKFYLGIKPFAAASGEKLEVSVNDYVKVIDLTKATTFSAGKIKKINFNYDKEEYVFTSESFELASSVAPGDRIIITSGTTGSVSVMKHYEGTNNNYKVVAASVSDGIITTTEDMAVLTVGGEADNLTLYDGATMYYLNATNTTGSNYLKASASVDEYAKWKVEFSSKAAVITNTGKSTRNIVRYNKGNTDTAPLFSCYSSGQADVYIFKKVKTLSSITLENPAPTVFYEGDTFSYDGTVIANYEDGTTEDVTTLATFTYDLSTTGAKQVEVSYKGKTATYDITVNAKPVIKFEATTKSINYLEVHGALEYSIENSINGNLEASCESDADWLVAESFYLSGTTSYEYWHTEANDGAERTGHLTFTYPHAEPVVITFIQEKSPDYEEPTSQTVTLKYSGSSTGNMTGNNDAATVGLDASKWSVIGAKGSASNFPGLNKDGDIRLYYHADGSNTITVTALETGVVINSIAITYTDDNYSNGKVLVGGSEVSISAGSYPINSNSFVITNGNTSNVQVRIKSIEITYTPAN